MEQYFCLCLPDWIAISSVVIPITFIYICGVCCCQNDKELPYFFAVVIPIMDLTVDILYIIQNHFYSYPLFVSSVLITFAYLVEYILMLNRDYTLPITTNPADSWVEQRKNQRIVWLSVGYASDIFPLPIDLRTGAQIWKIFDRNSNFIALIILLTSWVLLIAIQIFQIIGYTIAVMMGGFIIHALKLIPIRNIQKVWLKYYLLWRDPNSFQISGDIDSPRLNNSLWFQVMFITLPQLIVQQANNRMIESWSALAYLSTILKAYMVLHFGWKFLYYSYIANNDTKKAFESIDISAFYFKLSN